MKELVSIVFYLVGVVIGIYLIMLLIKLNKIVSSIEDLISSNAENINVILKNAPQITENITEISNEAKLAVDKLKTVVPDIVVDVKGVTEQVRRGSGSVSDTLETIRLSLSETAATLRGKIGDPIIILRIIQYIFSYFKKK